MFGINDSTSIFYDEFSITLTISLLNKHTITYFVSDHLEFWFLGKILSKKMEPTKPRPFSPSNKNETPKEWKRWKQEFLIYLRLSGGYDDYSEEERALFLQNLMGIEAIKAMEKISFDHENETKDMDILLMKFDEIFDPPSNEVEERFKFFSRRKNEKETIDDYVSDLEVN